jgi:hypothetical protein
MPSFGWDYPIQYLAVPESDRAARCSLNADACTIDGTWFFVRGCLEIPVHREREPFVWGAWVSLSSQSFDRWEHCYEADKRSHVGPFFGWLCSQIFVYPDTLNLKARVHLRDDGLRPSIELEPTDHPLAVEQREGISCDRVAEIYAQIVHGAG